MNKTFLRFWLFLSLFCVAAYTLGQFEIFNQIYEKDVTKLSFVIMGIFVLYTSVIGYSSWKLSDPAGSVLQREAKMKIIKDKISLGWFFSEIMLGLGMLGTVIGFILMLGDSMAELDINDTAKTTEVLGSMALGMSTALYTTAVGLVCSILLKIQLVNLESGVSSE